MGPGRGAAAPGAPVAESGARTAASQGHPRPPQLTSLGQVAEHQLLGRQHVPGAGDIEPQDAQAAGTSFSLQPPRPLAAGAQAAGENGEAEPVEAERQQVPEAAVAAGDEHGPAGRLQRHRPAPPQPRQQQQQQEEEERGCCPHAARAAAAPCRREGGGGERPARPPSPPPGSGGPQAPPSPPGLRVWGRSAAVVKGAGVQVKPPAWSLPTGGHAPVGPRATRGLFGKKPTTVQAVSIVRWPVGWICAVKRELGRAEIQCCSSASLLTRISRSPITTD